MNYLFNNTIIIAIFISLISFILAILPGGLAASSYIFLLICLIFRYKWSHIVFLNLCFLSLGNESLFTGLIEYGVLKYLVIFTFC